MGRHEKPDSPKAEALDPKSAVSREASSNKDQNKTSNGAHSADSKDGKK
ncbi:hypothetical protein [Nonomuraea sp. NPDC049028]